MFSRSIWLQLINWVIVLPDTLSRPTLVRITGNQSGRPSLFWRSTVRSVSARYSPINATCLRCLRHLVCPDQLRLSSISQSSGMMRQGSNASLRTFPLFQRFRVNRQRRVLGPVERSRNIRNVLMVVGALIAALLGVPIVGAIISSRN